MQSESTLVSERAVKEEPQRAAGAVSSVPAAFTASSGFQRNANSVQNQQILEIKPNKDHNKSLTALGPLQNFWLILRGFLKIKLLT